MVFSISRGSSYVVILLSVVIGYTPVCGCVLLLERGIGFPYFGMLWCAECCGGSRVDVGCFQVSCWLFLACCIVACVVSVDRFVSMLDIWRVCHLLWLVLFCCTHVFGGEARNM